MAQNEKGGLTLPFANRINLQRFQQTLESDEGDRVAAQIAEGTGTIAAELTLTIAARANSQQDGSTSAENGQQPTRQMQEPSELAKMALSLNGRLLRQ